MPEKSWDGPSLKSRVHSGETVLGVGVPMTIDRSAVEAVLEREPYEFLWVDSQHSAFEEERLISFCGMAAELGVHVVFRIRSPRDAHQIGSYMDLGPTGVEVPLVELESTVDEALSSFYYPQVGKRSWGGRSRLGFRMQDDRLDYARWWNETGVMWIQVESIVAVTNARGLAKTGVDCLSFGPADLSFSMESQPQHALKTVDDCVRHVVEQVRDTGTVVCFRNGSPDKRQKYIDMGVPVLLEQLPA